MYRKLFSHPELSLLISRTQEQQRLYQHWTQQHQLIIMLYFAIHHHKWFIQTRIPQIGLFTSQRITARPRQVLFALLLQTRHAHTHNHIWHHHTSQALLTAAVNLRGRSITAGERASLCNDDAYQCLSCKPCYWFSSVQPIVSTIFNAWKSAVMCLHRIQYPPLLMNTDKQLNLCIFILI